MAGIPLLTEEQFLKAKQQIDTEITNISELVEKVETDFTKHLGQATTQLITVTRDVSLTGRQTISGFTQKPKSLSVFACVLSNGNKVWSNGWRASNAQRCIYQANDSHCGDWDSAIFLADNFNGKGTKADVTIWDDKTVTLDWNHFNGGLTDVPLNAVINIVAHYHGGDE